MFNFGAVFGGDEQARVKHLKCIFLERISRPNTWDVYIHTQSDDLHLSIEIHDAVCFLLLECVGQSGKTAGIIIHR